MIKKIQESDAYNRMLFESSPIGLALCSSDGRLVDINQAYADIIGRNIEETKNLSYWDITPKGYADNEKQQLKTLDATGKYGPYEKEYIHKDGHTVPVSLLGQFIELNGEKYIWSSVEDISNRLETDKNIALNEKRLNEAQHLAKVGSWELDLLNNKLIWSNEIYRMFEIDQSAFEASYEAFLDVIHPDDRDKVNEAYTNSLTTQQPYEIVHRLKMNDGSIKHVRENCESFFDDKGRPIRSVGTVQDVTEIIIAEMELAKYREQLEFMVEDRTQQLRNAQDELIRKERLATLGQLTATVSHELRNPLGAMRPSLYVIEKTSDKTDTRIQSAIERVDRNISRCDHIIDELLDFSRITELNIKTTNIDRWLDSLIDEQVIAEGILLTKNFGLDELELDVDSNRLQRAVINVIENACHSMMDNNQVSVTDDNAHLDITTTRNRQRVEIIISDTGIGISEDVLDKIFEPLFSTKGFGVGLGMPTVKQIIEQHSGGVNIESKPGKGTKVTLWLPFNIKNKHLRLV
jgi:PAS domain S-box-containing protein